MNVRTLIDLATRTFRALSKMTWVPALLTRLFVGYFFFESGWSKIHNLADFTANFASWGIPYPAFNAALSAYTECFGGLLTIGGLGTRFVSVAMIINMAVAIVSVKLKKVAGLDDFVELDEPLYLLAYAWLLFSGAGWASLDAVIKLMISDLLPHGAESNSVEARTVATAQAPRSMRGASRA
jgi:putative oxidoreductase